MNTTAKKIPYGELAAAKKQRNLLRSRFENDVHRFIAKFGGDKFEVAHAIADSVLTKIDDTTKEYGTPSLPNGLAQTLLPSTQALIDGAEHNDPSPAVAPEKTTPALWGTLGTGEVDWTKTGQVVFSETVSQTPFPPLKMDIDVTEKDITANVLQYGKTLSKMNKLAKEMNTSIHGKVSYYVAGSTWISGTTVIKYGGPFAGYAAYVIRMSKKSPYISGEMIKDFNVKAPAGFKFRKLKNKPIYKLVPIKSYPNGVGKIKQKTAVGTDTISGPTTSLPHVLITPTSVEAIKKTVEETNLTPVPAYISVPTTSGHTLSLKLWSTYTGYIFKKTGKLPNGFTWFTDLKSDTATLIYVPEGTILPVEIAVSITPPVGTHWETYVISGGTKAILMHGAKISKLASVQFPPASYTGPSL